MTELLISIAEEVLFSESDITVSNLHQKLSSALKPGIDFAEIFCQSRYVESWAQEEGIVKKANFSIDRGIATRAISGEKSALAYANEISLAALRKTIQSVGIISSCGHQGTLLAYQAVKGHKLYLPLNPLSSFSEQQKVDFLQKLDARARQQDSRIKQVFINLAGSYEVILVLASDGDFAVDIRPLVRMDVTVIAENNGRYEQGNSGGGRRTGYEFFLQNQTAEFYVDEAVRMALLNLKADSAPGGQMPVVLGSGWSGVLLHEAIGHGLEGDFIRKGSSAFAGKLNQKVASDICTVVDCGKLPEARRGSLNVDDEGTPTTETVLIENGVLKGFMYDKLNAKLMGTKSTGNGRRESYACLPIPRMTNTYIYPGKYSREEIIASVKKGIYAVNFSGGQVDITSGKFVFTTSEAYLIEKGKITAPIKDVTLIGDGPAVLKQVSMVGNDLEFDFGVGTCGKEGQSVPVGVGQPTLKVDQLTVGGQKI